MDKAEKLKSILELLQNDTVKPSDIEKFLKTLLDFVAKTNEAYKALSTENIQKIKDALTELERVKLEIQNDTNTKNDKLSNEIKKLIAKKSKEIDGLIEEVKSWKPENGKDAKPEDVVPLVLEKLPKTEIFKIQGKGEEIVDEINSLGTEPEKQIDASHIKNLPKQIKEHSFVVQRNLAWFDEDTLVIENPTRIKFTGAGVQLSMDSTGMLVATISGTASNESIAELLTNTGDDLNFTFTHTPTSVSVVWDESTGQVFTPGVDYTYTGSTLTFNNAQTGRNIRANYAY